MYIRQRFAKDEMLNFREIRAKIPKQFPLLVKLAIFSYLKTQEYGGEIFEL